MHLRGCVDGIIYPGLVWVSGMEFSEWWWGIWRSSEKHIITFDGDILLASDCVSKVRHCILLVLSDSLIERRRIAAINLVFLDALQGY